MQALSVPVRTMDGKKNTTKELNIFCSFCGKNGNEVKKMAAGRGAYICDECVERISYLFFESDSPEEELDESSYLECGCCGYRENENEERFIGIFADGISFSGTDRQMCALYGCPECGTVRFVTNADYIRMRKEEYKKQAKAEKE